MNTDEYSIQNKIEKIQSSLDVLKNYEDVDQEMLYGTRRLYPAKWSEDSKYYSNERINIPSQLIYNLRFELNRQTTILNLDVITNIQIVIPERFHYESENTIFTIKNITVYANGEKIFDIPGTINVKFNGERDQVCSEDIILPFGKSIPFHDITINAIAEINLDIPIGYFLRRVSSIDFSNVQLITTGMMLKKKINDILDCDI